jgi:hypothetical protein
VADYVQSVRADGARRTQNGERFHSNGANTSRNCHGITQCRVQFLTF